MHTHTINRRALLGAIGIVPVAAVVAAVPAHAIKAPTADRAEWDKNLATYNAAQAAYFHFDDTTLAAAQDALTRAEKAVPHVSFTNRHGQTVSTADEAEVRGCRASLKSIRYVERCAWEDVKAQQDLVDAADARAAKVQSLPERAALDRAETESERLSEISYAAYVAVAKTPVSSASLLQEKWAWLVRESDVSTWHDNIAADIGRIAAREA